jgi:large subunit ribosomal protein L6
MSRVGKAPIEIPAGVKVSVNGTNITVEGPKGKLSREISELISVELSDKEINFSRPNEEKFSKSIHGTTRALVQNMVTGVSAGFSKVLEIVGVGYRVEQKGADLNLLLGFSHPVLYKAPAGIELKAETQLKIVISGVDKQVVGQVAAEIRKYRSPEPYKGKGIKYAGEIIRRKQGKRTGK